VTAIIILQLSTTTNMTDNNTKSVQI